MTSEAKMAVAKDSILNPSIKFEAIRSRMALITNRKSPRDSRVAGKVSSISTGLTRMFKMARTRATIIAVVLESILNPGTR